MLDVLDVLAKFLSLGLARPLLFELDGIAVFLTSLLLAEEDEVGFVERTESGLDEVDDVDVFLARLKLE